MERLLHYVWKHRLFPLGGLATVDGRRLEVVDTGVANADAGPDFFNAKVRLDGVTWAGNVEIHRRSSDWFRHGHHADPAYASVILHVAEEVDAEILRPDGRPVPQLRLPCPASVREGYRELLVADGLPPCRRVVPALPPLRLHAWLSALQAERLERKALRAAAVLERRGGGWEEAFFAVLARGFGFGLNGDAFEEWASRVPLRAVDKHRDDLLQVEALFFGQAGLLEPPGGDDYYLRLRGEYAHLARKFGLSPMDASRWRFLRLRPAGFPHVRLAQLARLCHGSPGGLFSRVMEAETLPAVRALLGGGVSGYWLTHYAFGSESPSRPGRLGRASADSLVVNVVATFLHAYGRHRGDESLPARAARFLEEIRPEDNRVTRAWAACGLRAANAADSQALLQLQAAYCDRKRCLDCRIGYEFLKAPRPCGDGA